MKTSKHFSAVVLASTIGLALVSAAHSEGSRETAALNKSTLSLTQATQLVEKQEQGKTISAVFDLEKDRAVWEVKVLGGSGVKEYKVDAMSGAVIKIEDENIRGKLTNLVTGMNLKDLNGAKTSLSQAISTAEQKFKGKAVKVEVEHERGGIQYDIFVRAGDKTEKVKIEAATGRTR